MPVINSIANFSRQMAEWRQHIHQHPEIGLECQKTSLFIVQKLKEFGVDEISQGWAKTGVVAIITGRGEGETIGLRADMDALPILEQTGLEYASKTDGAMHACGHDGHTTMLLGAAKYLADTRNFSGRVALIFQPDEEDGGGGGVMCDEGMIEKFEITQIFALHNIPDLPLGRFTTREGPFMASVTDFEIVVTGKGGHPAHPQSLVNPIMVATEIVSRLDTIIDTRSDPVESGLLSVTQIHAGSTFNVIPETAHIMGTLRCFSLELNAEIQQRISSIIEDVADARNASALFKNHGSYPPTINDAERARFAAKVAATIVGPDQVSLNAAPQMVAEDFSYMLNKVPGAFLFIGNGPGAGLHHPEYNFNDEVSVFGASFFAKIVETAQPLNFK